MPVSTTVTVPAKPLPTPGEYGLLDDYFPTLQRERAQSGVRRGRQYYALSSGKGGLLRQSLAPQVYIPFATHTVATYLLSPKSAASRVGQGLMGEKWYELH